MSERWYYSQSDQAHGPFSADEIKALAAEGKIAPADLVWPEGAKVSDRVPADAVFDFGAGAPTRSASENSATRTRSASEAPQAVTSSREPTASAAPEGVETDVKDAPKDAPGDLPNWLQDVSAQERSGPLPEPELLRDLPEWIDDMRLWVALELGESPWEMEQL